MWYIDPISVRQRFKRGLELKEEEQRINVSSDNNAKSKIESCRFQKSHWAKEEKEGQRWQEDTC